MGTAVATGDCNTCHTQTGTSSAPGRITLPR
jgi:predicted CXXCH cytochrome family protein